jgi:translocation and assembly module TamA
MLFGSAGFLRGAKRPDAATCANRQNGMRGGMNRTLPPVALLLLILASGTLSAQPNLTVEVSGVSGAERDNVLLMLSIEQQKTHPDLSDGRIRRLHARSPEEIAQALAPFGFYRVVTESELTQTEQGWSARYRIEPGPPLPIGKVDVGISGEAAHDPAFRELLDAPPLSEGDTFNHTLYEKWKRELQRLADERGYFQAKFTTHSVQVDLAAYTATVELQLESGPRYFFGPLNFSGDILLDESLLRRYAPFTTGEPYSTAKLMELQDGLNGSNYFAHVDIQAGREAAADLHVPISVKLVMNKRTRYQLGVGFGTDTGARGIIGMERRYLNRKGHRYGADFRISQIKDSIGARYIIPLEKPSTDRAVVRSEYLRDRTEDIDSSALLVGAGVEHAEGFWHRSYFLNYQREKFEIGLQSGNARLLMPTLNWSRLDTPNVLFAPSGSRIGLQLRGAREGIASNTSLAQADLSAKFIRPAGGGRFLLRGEVGTTSAPDFDALPPSVRFFAGGDTSVRGYAYKSLGPTDSAGNVIGGKHLLVGSAEYEYPLGAKWSAALFFDAGNAFAEYDGELEQGAGIGLRRRLPIGWLRIDVAQAITQEDKPFRFHITLGPDL